MSAKNGKRVDWPVRTVYYNGKREPLKTTYAKHPIRALAHAVMHLALDEYNATVAEILDPTNTALPYGVYTRTPTGHKCVYKRDMTKYPLPSHKKSK